MLFRCEGQELRYIFVLRNNCGVFPPGCWRLAEDLHVSLTFPSISSQAPENQYAGNPVHTRDGACGVSKTAYSCLMNCKISGGVASGTQRNEPSWDAICSPGYHQTPPGSPRLTRFINHPHVKNISRWLYPISSMNVLSNSPQPPRANLGSTFQSTLQFFEK